MRIARIARAACIVTVAALTSPAHGQGLLAAQPGGGVTVVDSRASEASALARWGNSTNRVIHEFNGWLSDGWNALVPSARSFPVSAAVESAVTNLLLNWINEPLTMASYAASGRFASAGVSGQRFLVNTFRGWGGMLDPATEIGLVVPRVDFGLALCSHGMPPGPYIVLPIAGPRTLRDGAADLLAVNALIYVALLPLGLPVGTVVLILLGGEVVDLGMIRQIDAVPDEIAERDYERARAAYLADRERRCELLRATR